MVDPSMLGADRLKDSSSGTETTDKALVCQRSMNIDVSIIIPTLRREQWLINLIPRCFGQLGCADGQIEVIVVDNCPLQSAKPVVDRLSETFGPSLHYISRETARSIACEKRRRARRARASWVHRRR